jgi:hypothetical protein
MSDILVRSVKELLNEEMSDRFERDYISVIEE